MRHADASSLYNLFSVAGKNDGEANVRGNAKKLRSGAGTLLAACIVLSAAWGQAQEKKNAPELVVAAAADLSTALQEIGDAYEKKTGVKVKLSFGASGALTQQIQKTEPRSIYFSQRIWTTRAN